MYDKLKATKVAIGTITGRLFDLFSYVANPITWAGDEEQIHPIEETRRKKATDLALIKAGKTPGSYMGALRQTQYSKMLGEHLKTLTNEGKQGIDLTLKDIGVIMYGTGYEAPDAPEELGPNFGKWVNTNEKMLSSTKGWENILKTYGSQSTPQYAAVKE